MYIDMLYAHVILYVYDYSSFFLFVSMHVNFMSSGKVVFRISHGRGGGAGWTFPGQVGYVLDFNNTNTH